MSNFDIKLENVEYTDEKKPRRKHFTLTFMQKNHDIALGYYVVYPGSNGTELILTPKFVFDQMVSRFEELSQYNAEVSGARKSKFKKSGVGLTDSEVAEFRRLRNFISHSCEFKISGSQSTVVLPGKYLDILNISDDFLTFVQMSANEYIIVNPRDAWLYSDRRNFNYSDEYNSPKAIFGRLKRAAG